MTAPRLGRCSLATVGACLVLTLGQGAAWGSDGFEQRRQELLEHYADGPGSGLYVELARIAIGRAPNESAIHQTLDKIDARQDCADFGLPGVLRLLYGYADSPLVSPALLDRARQSLLDFKYWPDEPGIDSMCTWTENHQILFAAGAYLAGQLFPNDTFTNSGRIGEAMMVVHRPRILRWLELRYRTGFSEWLSNVYYDEDLAGLLALVDLCQDEEIALRAAMVTDLLLLDMALNSHEGVFGSTHGRSYESQNKWADREATTDAQWLLFGTGVLGSSSMCATCLALSEHYRMPPPIGTIANDRSHPSMVNRQRMSLRVEDPNPWGLGFDNNEDAMVWLSLEAYAHPLMINQFVDMLDAWNWWDNAFFAPFAENRQMIEDLQASGGLVQLVKTLEYDVCRNLRDEVNIYTFRTPDYMLSSAQDYRVGFGGDQQHIWQATLGPNAVCFTTHPARYEGDSPNYWTGSGWLPRVAQHENVALIVYNAIDRPGLYVPETLDFTHAWLPRDQFDEVLEQDGWVLARYGDGYLALRSQNPYTWQTEPGEDQNREMVAPGRENVWVCELGCRDKFGAFENFVIRITNAGIQFDPLGVQYDSPTQGFLEFSWSGQFLRNGQPVELGDYPRYGNPYVWSGFPAGRTVVHHGGHALCLDWDQPDRQVAALPVFGPAAACLAGALMIVLGKRAITR